MQQHETLIMVVIVAVVLTMLVVFMGAVLNVGQESDSACAISVLTRIQSLRFSDTITTPLECYTTAREVPSTLSDRRFEAQLLSDYAACHRDFGAAFNQTMLAQENTFCFVCALYDIEGERVVENWHEQVTSIVPGFETIEEEEDLSEPLEMSGQYAVMFYQVRLDDFARANELYQAIHGPATTAPTGGVVGGAASWWSAGVTIARIIPQTRLPATLVGAVAGMGGGYYLGKVVSGHDIAESGIIIMPYDARTLDEQGCTVFARR